MLCEAEAGPALTPPGPGTRSRGVSLLGLRSPHAKGPEGVGWAGLACGTSPPAAGTGPRLLPPGACWTNGNSPWCPHPMPVWGHLGRTENRGGAV